MIDNKSEAYEAGFNYGYTQDGIERIKAYEEVALHTEMIKKLSNKILELEEKIENQAHIILRLAKSYRIFGEINNTKVLGAIIIELLEEMGFLDEYEKF